jgi:hypothetical protein
MSSADAWRDTAPRLAHELRITEHRTSTEWRDWFEHQAAQVHGTFGHLPAGTIAVGHSNGGLVARQWSKSRNLRAIVTMGTPHEGALLAQRGTDVLGFNDEIFGLVNAVIAVVGGPENEFSWMWPFLLPHASFVQVLSAASISELLVTFGLGAVVPVLGQMLPQSAFLQNLNGGLNLARESATVRDRIGMVFVAREYWRAGLAAGLRPEVQQSVAEKTQVAIVMIDAVAAYVYHNYPWNPRAQNLYLNLVALSQRLRSLDAAWCWAVTGDASCATSHDGIVGTPAQYYPGGTNLGYYGPPHLWQIRESPPMLHDVLATRLGVEVRTASPPPPPPPGPPPGPASTLTAGQSLRRDEELRSPNGLYRLVYQGDGNLVLYRVDGPALWSSATHGTLPGSVEMQGDGNLVVYDGTGRPVWHADTWWAPGSRAVLTDQGYLIIFDEAGTAIWWSGGE